MRLRAAGVIMAVASSKVLPACLHEGGVILPQSARHRTRGRLVNFDEDAATLLKRELDQTLHHFHHQNTLSPAR